MTPSGEGTKKNRKRMRRRREKCFKSKKEVGGVKERER